MSFFTWPLKASSCYYAFKFLKSQCTFFAHTLKVFSFYACKFLESQGMANNPCLLAFFLSFFLSSHEIMFLHTRGAIKLVKRIWCFNQPICRISPPFRKERSFIDGWQKLSLYQQSTTNLGQLEEHDGWSTYAMVFMLPFLRLFTPSLQGTMEDFVELHPTNLGRCQDLFSYKNKHYAKSREGVWSRCSRMLGWQPTNALDRASSMQGVFS